MPTPNLGLTQPPINPTYDLWGADMNQNLALIDAASITLRGTPVAATAPTLNQVLKFNGTSWAPGTDAGGVTGSGTTGKLSKWVGGTALGNSILSDDGVTLLVAGNVNASSYMVAGVALASTHLSDSAALVRTGTALGGDLSGTHGAAVLSNIQGNPLLTAGAVPGNLLRFDGVNWAASFSASYELIDGNTLIRSDGLTAMGADLDLGTFKIVNLATPIVSSDAATKGYVDGLIGAATYTATPNTLMSRDGTGGTTVSYLNATSVVTQTIQISSGGAQGLVLTSDATGNATWQAVSSIQGVDVSATAPTAGQILKLVGGVWTPSSDLGLKQDLSEKGQASGYAALDGSGKVPQTQLPAIAITDTFVVADQAARLALTAQTGDVAIQQDVATTYILRGTNPAVNADWEQLLFPNTAVQSVTGTAPIAIGGTLINPIVSINPATASLQGSTRMSVAPASAGDPISVGDNDPRVANVAHGSGTTGKLAKWSAGTTLSDSIVSEAGSVATVTGTLNATVGLQVGGVALASTHLSDVATLIKTTTSLGGDLSGNLPNATVAKVNGVAVTGTPTSGQTIVATSGTAATWQTPASASALKTTGADVTVSAAAPPTTGQVLTATGATTATWQTPSGGSGGGYATVVVAAPTGVAATDTSNIQTAINSISFGTVILREGLYLVNAALTIKSRITIKGQGKGEFGAGAATTIKCDNAFPDAALIDDSASTKTDFCMEDLAIDFNGFTRPARSGQIDLRLNGVRSRLRRISMANTSGTSIPVQINCTNSTEIDSPLCEDCIFVQGKVVGSQAFSLSGRVTNCTFVGNTATAGFQSGLVAFNAKSTVTGCVFRTSVDYTTGVSGSTVSLTGSGPISIVGCIFIQESGTATRALQINDGSTGPIAVVGCTANSTSAGTMSVRTNPGNTSFAGNVGFGSYTGAGASVGNV